MKQKLEGPYTIWFRLPDEDAEFHLEIYGAARATIIWSRLEQGGFIVRGTKP